MRPQSFSHYLLAITYLLISFGLDHEKSFLQQDGASNVLALDLHKDSLLVSVSNDIVQKDIRTGAVQRTFRAHENTIYSFVVTNGSRMVSSGYDDMIIVWDLETGSIIKRISLKIPDMRMYSIAVQDDLVIAGGLDSRVRLVDLASGRLIRTVDMGGHVYSVAVEGKHFYVGKKGRPYVIRALIESGITTLTYDGHTNTVFSIHLANNTLVSGSGDLTVICWNAGSGEIIRVLSGPTEIVYAVGYYDGYVFAGGSDKTVIKWNIEDGQILKRFPVFHAIGIMCFAYRSFNLYTGSIDSTVLQWNAVTGGPLFRYAGRNTKLRAVAAWKQFVISAGEDLEIKVWDASKDSIEPFQVLFDHLNSINCLTVYENDLYSGSSDFTVKQWDLMRFALSKAYNGPTRAVDSIIVDQSSVYSSGYEKNIYQWNISSVTLSGLFVGHSTDVPSLQIYSGLLFSGSEDKTIRAWNTQSRQSLTVFKSVDQINAISITQDTVIACTLDGLETFLISTGLSSVYLKESISCGCIVSRGDRAYTGHPDGIVRVRHSQFLTLLETYQGHTDYAFALCFDESFNLYSTGFDGTIKKWNMASRKVAFSFENRLRSVTALSAIENLLYMGSKGGDIFTFNIENAFASQTLQFFNQSVTSLLAINGSCYASSTDGLLLHFSKPGLNDVFVVYNSSPEQLKSLSVNKNLMIAIKGDSSIVFLSNNGLVKTATFQAEMLCIAATDTALFAGSRTGIIYSFTIETLELDSELKGHVSQVNYLMVVGENLFSASADKSIIEWSLKNGANVNIYQRRSASALGHLGPVNALSYCSGTLFSAGSDLSVRRWNTQTGRHEDVYFGFKKPVTSVLCHNRSVFAGSEDFSVLMFKPSLMDSSGNQASSYKASVSTKRNKLKRVFQRPQSIGFSITSTLSLALGSVILVLLIVVASVIMYATMSKNQKGSKPSTEIENNSNTAYTDLQTVVNSVMGISKHAAYLMSSSLFARVRKLASGGGGELFIVRVMDSSLQKKVGDTVIQKVVFVNNKASEEAFFQEVGIMIMLSSFPNFCQIIGYTENPLSMILKYYPHGSLHEWLRKSERRSSFEVKLLKELAQALITMHSHYLAHCDVKSQNVLIQLDNSIPSSYLTDFGITQVLSEKILASRAFKVINLRGLSINYASPEAFTNFRLKNYARTDFKKYDVYSYACVIYETLTRNAPWH